MQSIQLRGTRPETGEDRPKIDVPERRGSLRSFGKQRMPSPAPHAIRVVSQAIKQRLLVLDPSWMRKAPHLLRHRNTVIHALHFQASQFGSSESGTFTVNLCVTEPRIYQAWTGRPLPSNPATALYPVQERIGRLSDKPHDRWWEIGASTDLLMVQDEVWELVERALVRFFPTFCSLEDMLACAREKGSLPGLAGGQNGVTHGILEALLGHADEARGVFLRTIADFKVPAFSANVRRAAKNAGIDL